MKKTVKKENMIEGQNVHFSIDKKSRSGATTFFDVITILGFILFFFF